MNWTKSLKAKVSVSTVLVVCLIGWVVMDRSWVDVYIFNKSIVQTNILKWVPIAILWSFFDNVVDSLYKGSKLHLYLKSLFNNDSR